MKIVAKKYFKSFLLYGLTFGLLMTLWDYIDEGKIDIIKLLFMSVFFGGIMSWTTVTAQKRAITKQGKKELTEDDFKVSQCESIIKEITIKEIYELLNSNETTNKWKLDIKNSKIIGKTKTSWSSWGEKIIISVLKENIKIESKPVLKTTMFDNGRNRENVLLIKQLIEKH